MDRRITTATSLLREHSFQSLEQKYSFQKSDWGIRAVLLLDGIGRTARNSVAASIDRMIGIFLAPLSVVGCDAPQLVSPKRVKAHLLSAQLLIPNIFKECLEVINPDASFEANISSCREEFPKSLQECELPQRVRPLLEGTLLILGACIDLLFTVICVPLSIVTFGTNKNLNMYTHQALCSLSIDIDIYSKIMRFIHPSW